ncbi:carbon monoxide dehydrogenase E protein [Serinicoccus hydrothermalis]|uniref:Carbon monoxide dehydrogenase E protein n=1 Tax=Serinicoccus hydrothermalis TaxID=1758689 RepID=A0A1B1N8E6_9MICO|nr:VWA domain-containing protein [Serinicoccus hydrothermalis]ANS77702.1 carbon monoxide dehydrogenase E protein [Serinicoccus hydrothermalis]
MTEPAEPSPSWGIGQTLGGFARACRAAGLPVTADRERTFLRACAATGLGDRRGVYWAGRATLTASPADLAAYDQVFTGWFGGRPMHAVSHDEPPAPTTVQASLEEPAGGEGPGEQEQQVVRAAASAQEVLRHRDVAGLAPADRAALRRQFATLRPRPPTRPARRHTRARRGEVDGRATVRAHLRNLGEPTRIRWRDKAMRRRRVVLLVDVSGSMSSYADALLRLAHTVVQSSPATTEVFTVGTRLTHVTRALRERDPDRALLAAGETVPDWSGGTRLGEAVDVFLRRWGRRGMARGAVVVVLSDGWERQAPEALGEQMRRLRALAHRVIWVNPHRGKAGYAPVQAGIVAALPHVDEFVAGHSLAAFEELLDVIAEA